MARTLVITGTIAALLVAALLVVATWFVRDMRRAYARVAQGSTVVALDAAVVEFAEGGSGMPVLVIHGSGGGFDQGALIARAVLDERFRWIAPSRFGYLRSSLPPGASFDDQARAYVQLLDHLGIERVAVIALSHGGPSALLLAAQYPQRVASLTLISCGVASAPGGAQAQADRKGDALTTIFSHDLLYWGVSTALRRPLMGLMGVDAAVVANLDAGQRRLVDEVIDDMNPVSPRATGVAFDHGAALPNERIAAIRAPTLVLHARDDSLQLFRNAEYAAATIPGARLHAFEAGGHLLIAVEQQALRDEVQRFILDPAHR